MANFSPALLLPVAEQRRHPNTQKWAVIEFSGLLRPEACDLIVRPSHGAQPPPAA